MRIAFVNATNRWGGVKTWMLEFAKHLSWQGHPIYIYGRQQEFIALAKKYVGHGVQISFGLDINPITISKFFKEFRNNCIDIVIINVGKDLATAGIAARLAGIPVVQRVGLPYDIPYRLKTYLIHSFVQPLFLSPCQYIAKGLKKSLPYIKEQNVTVICNGRKASNEILEIHTPRRFICTQQLEPNKCHSVLLEAFSKVEDEFELHIWGVGSIEQELKSQVNRLGLNRKVFFHGFSMDITNELKKGDIFLLASVSEGLPNTLLEAMASGLLPIVRLVGGVEEVLTVELQKWALPYNASVEDFQKFICKALKLSIDELLRLREHSRDACRKIFDIDTQVIKFESWLNSVISNRGQSKRYVS